MKISVIPGARILSQLKELEQHIDYPKVNQAVRQAKLENKQRLANYIGQQLNVVVNPKALFDVQIKRIHEYKRQLMNVLHVITRYNRSVMYAMAVNQLAELLVDARGKN